MEIFWEIIKYVLLSFAGIVTLYLVVLNVTAYVFTSGKKFYKHNSKFCRFLLNTFVVVELVFGRIRIHVTGKEKLPKGTRFLFVSNHRSKFDPQIQWLYLRKYDLAFISKESNFHVPGYGRLIRRCCFLMIDRQNARQSMTTLNKASELIESNEVSMAIYPEGTRCQDGHLQEFHNGVFKVAQKANVPVVIATMSGTEKIHTNFFFKRTDVYFDVVGVLDSDYVTSHSTIEIGDEVRSQMESSLAKREG